MSKYLQAVVAFYMLLLTGCVSQETQNATAKAASAINATKYSISKAAATATGKGSYKSLNIEFSNFEGLPESYSNEKLSSAAAVIFLENLQPKDYEGYSKIEVTLKRENMTFERLYDIEQLTEAEKHIKIAKDLVKAFYQKSFEALQPSYDTSFISVSDQEMINTLYLKVDSAFGQVNKSVFTGFKFSEVTDKKVPVFVSSFQLRHDSAYTNLSLMLDSSSHKIVSISLNSD